MNHKYKNRKNLILISLTGIVLYSGVSATGKWQVFAGQDGGAEKMPMQIKSSAFDNNATIPKKYTCEGEDISPPLEWADPPEGTKSFAIICDDPDAPVGTWVHWVAYNIPAGRQKMEEKIPKEDTLPDGTKQGMTDFKRTGYGGPCPPPGPVHRYFFKLYALDSMLELSPRTNKTELEKKMQGHILEKTQLIGLYKR